MKLAVLGSLNMDLVVTVPRLPKEGETLHAHEMETYPGGKGANQAVAASRLGAEVLMIGAVGRDRYGERLLENLMKEGVDHSRVKELKDVATGLALVFLTEKGDNNIVVIPGANFAMDQSLLDLVDFEGIDQLLAQFETPMELTVSAFERAREAGVKTILNPAPARPRSDDLLSVTDLVILNEGEFEVFTGYPEKRWKEGMDLLFKKGVKEVILTLGEKGARYMDQEGALVEVPAEEVKVIDTTGAGDAFIGAYLVALGENKPPIDALRFATKAAARAIGKKGAQSALPSREEL